MNERQLTLSRLLGLAALFFAIAGILVITAPTTAQAQDSAGDMNETDSDYCVVCHAGNASSFTLADGSVHSAAVDTDVLNQSVHGASNPDGALACSDCHQSAEFPHDTNLPLTDRAYTVSRSISCTDCHEEQTENLADSVHYTALADGHLNAATCVDCHGGHDVQPVAESSALVSETCGTCHVTTFSQYENSVHGEALLGGDTNAPACTDCHGVHQIQHPTTALFRNRSPELCATCHADEELMAEYDISTNVFDSYVTDFHGTTVSLFNQTDPNVPTNKAVCYDCHGVHDITRADDDKGQVVRENLLETCQQCHPGATSDFPDSWIGHFEPTVDSHPLLFGVRWFYAIVIPMTLVGFGVLVGSDVFRRIRNAFGKKETH